VRLDPRRRRILGAVLLAGGLAGALLLTLWPLHFDLAARAIAQKWEIAEWELYYVRDDGSIVLDWDLFLNLFLLAPMGVGWAILRPGASVARVTLESALLGVGAAAAIEAAQLLTPDRVTQLADLWRNGSGCIVGAAVATIVGRSRR
jgi:hypothetical protein